jgi:hypothetical protein
MKAQLQIPKTTQTMEPVMDQEVPTDMIITIHMLKIQQLPITIILLLAHRRVPRIQEDLPELVQPRIGAGIYRRPKPLSLHHRIQTPTPIAPLATT